MATIPVRLRLLSRVFLGLATLALPACTAAASGGRPASPNAAAQPAAPVPAPAGNVDAVFGTLTYAGDIAGLHSPESIVLAPGGGGYLVSNTNGNAGTHKDNGFISHVRLDGTVDVLHFIQGGRGGVHLDAPLGLGLTGNTLWVADVDAVRTFDARTGAPLRSYDLASMGARLLNGIGVAPDGAVYITDTAVRTAGGQPQYVGPDHIFRVAHGRVTTALTGTSIRGPNGITWDHAHHRFIVVSFMGNGVWGWNPRSGALTRLATGPGKFDGVSLTRDGQVLVTSWADSSAHVLRGGVLPVVIRGGLPTPADMHVDSARGRVLLPLSSQNRVDLFTLPAGR